MVNKAKTMGCRRLFQRVYNVAKSKKQVHGSIIRDSGKVVIDSQMLKSYKTVKIIVYAGSKK